MKSIHQRDRRLSVSTLSAAIWLALYGAPVAAQTSPAPESIQVTGTRVTRAEAETALPVTIYTKEDIRATGQATIAEVLRTLTFNTQGSSTPVVASTGQGVTDVNLRGLGFGRTLVLVNGRRVPTDSNFFGFSVSTQFIPLGAIERIEILREGASAIYGSDALGGVVNIILSDRYDGVSANFAYTRPTGGGGSAQIYGVTAGFGADRTSAIIAVEHRHTDAVRKADRDVLRSDFSNLGFGFLSNSFPPTYRARDFFGNGSNIAGPLAAAPGCDPALVRTTGPLTLTNAGQSITTGPQTECRNPVANKSDFAPEFDVNSIYGKGRWAFTNELSVFLEGMYVRQDSTGSSNPVTTTLTLAATNPNNPTRNASATSPIAGVTSPRSVSALFALPDQYGRTLESNSTYRNLVVGGDWKPAAGDLSFYYQDAKQYADNFYHNALNRGAFNAAIAAGSVNPFDIASPGAYASYVTTGTRYTESKLQAANLNWSSQVPFAKLPGGPIRYGVGYDWRKESLLETCDALTGAFALSGAFCFGRPLAERNINALYAEGVFPILSVLEFDYAGRRDNYSVPNFKKGTNRFALRYQPVKSVTLRGSYSEGVRAPNLFEISSASGLVTSSIIDSRRCAAAGGNPQSPACQPIAVQQTIKGGPDLMPEESKSKSFGVIWTPSREFNLSVDYYRVKVDNQILNIGSQTVADLEAQGLNLANYSVSVTRDASGMITAITSGSANVPGFQTSGIDTEANFIFDLKDKGRIKSRLLFTWVKEFKRPAAPGAPIFDAVGFVDQPDKLFNWSNNWTLGRWSADLRWNYVAGYDARSPEQANVLNLQDQGRIGSYQTFDLSVTYETPWKGVISVGARNIANRQPTVNRFAYGD
ncbi:MAG TPA: TonB-dependent receptor, partial [Usitatibacter sp.]|nr:TonB-dependent receptor [Usitatibacter sp.]